MTEKYGFVYLWYDRKHKRFYLGCRWGHVDDGYICSSTWMKQGYKHRPFDFKRRILETNVKDRKLLLEKEAKWLSLISTEELGKRYYNLCNHHFGHWSSSKEKYSSAIEKMKETKKKTLDNMTIEERKLKYGSHKKGKASTFKGKTHTPEVIEKIKKSRAAQVFSEETMQKKKQQIPWNKGKTGIYSEEAKKKMPWNKGKKTGPRTEETKRKIGEKNKDNMLKKWSDEEYRLMQSQSHMREL